MMMNPLMYQHNHFINPHQLQPAPPPPPGYSMHTTSGYGYGPTHFTPAPPPTAAVVTTSSVDWPALPSSPLVTAPTTMSVDAASGKTSPLALAPMMMTSSGESKGELAMMETTAGPNAATATAATSLQQHIDNSPVAGPTRALYLGNIRGEQTTYYDLCRLANQFGPLESVKMVPAKSCAFVNFLYEIHAKEFYDKNSETPLQLGSTPLRVGWAKAPALSEELMGAVRAGATRNLFVGNLASSVMDDHLVAAFAKFGDIENIVRMPPKNMAFVNMTDIKHALSAKAALDGMEMGGRPIKVNFAKEGANTRPPTFLTAPSAMLTATNPSAAAVAAAAAQAQAAQVQAVQQAAAQAAAAAFAVNAAASAQAAAAAAANPYAQQFPYGGAAATPSPLPPYGGSGAVATPMMPGLPGAPEALSRGLYIGNVPEGVTYHDICKIANRFGGLDSVKLVPAKSCAFFNFIDKEAAQAMYLTSQQTPITMGNRQLRVNWAKSGPLGKDVQEAIVKHHASRCLFLGNISESTSEEMLRSRFSAFGEFDSIVIMRSKGIAFVNMTSIKSAITAREQLNGTDLEGQVLKINFAKEGATRAMSPQMMMQTGSTAAAAAVPAPAAPSNVAAAVIPHMGISGHPVAYLPAVPPTLPPIPWTPPLPGTPEAALLPQLPSPPVTPATATSAPTPAAAPAVPASPSTSSSSPPTSSEAAPVVVGGAPDAAPVVTVTPIVNADAAVNIQLTVSSIPFGYEDFVESSEASRAVLLLGLAPDVAYHDICQLANRFGGLDSVRLSPSRQQCLITFFEPSCALAMHTQFQNNQLLVRGQPLRVAWGRSKVLTSEQSTLVRAGASRNLWVGGVAEGVTEPMLYELFLPYGEFDSIVIMRQKNIAFVNLTSLASAVAARAALQGAIMLGQPIKINFAKEAIRRAPV